MTNYAENQAAYDRGDISLPACFGKGREHRAYGWAPIIPPAWDDRQRRAYMDGFDRADIAQSDRHFYRWTGEIPCTGVYRCTRCGKVADATGTDYSLVDYSDKCKGGAR